MSSSKEFDYTMNALKAIGIIAIVASHVNISLNATMFSFFSWHIPLFFFISGYFFNLDTTAFKQKIKKYIKIFYSYHFFYGLVTYFIYIFLHRIYGALPSLKTLIWAPLSYAPFEISAPSWFFPALILASIFFFFSIKIIKKCNLEKFAPYIYLILAVIAIFITNSDLSPLAGTDCGLKKVVIRTLISSYYMYVGYLYKHSLEPHFKYTVKGFLLAITIQAAIYFATGGNTALDLNYAILPHNIAPLITPFTTIYIFIYLIKKVPLKLLTSGIIYKTGNMSLNIMMNHVFAIFLTELLIIKLNHQSLSVLTDSVFKLYNIDQLQFVYLCSGIILCLTFGKLQNKIKNLFKGNYET